MIDLAKLFDLGYLFDLRPTVSTATLVFFGVIFVLMLLSALYLNFSAKKLVDAYKIKIYKRYIGWLTGFAVCGLVWLLMRAGEIQLLASRFWFLVIIIIFAVKLGFILKYQYKVAPQAAIDAEKRKIFNKYLPKRK